MTPVTKENEWLSVLGDIPVWVPRPGDLVVVTPHPDDEILGAGGLIAAHRRQSQNVTVLAVTDGEAAYPNSIGLAETRRAEQEKALARVGVTSHDIIRLRLADGNVASGELELAEMLLSVIRENSVLVAPWNLDPHPDHEACGRAAAIAARIYKIPLVSYFFWTWHRLFPRALNALALRRFELDPELRKAKAAALDEYHSQLRHEDGEPILPYQLLAPAHRSFETFVVHDYQH